MSNPLGLWIYEYTQPDFDGKRELTISQLARRVGVSRSHLARVVSGERAPSTQLVDKVCAELGLEQELCSEYIVHNVMQVLASNPDMLDAVYTLVTYDSAEKELVVE